jgi:hypothetical protein
MLARVKHIVEVVFVQIDIAWLAKQVRDEYREIIVGDGSRIVRGQVLWDQFEVAVANCLADPKRDHRQLTEKINELAVAALLVADTALAERSIEYEPAMLADGRKIDFVVDRGADNLYVEVKTVSPRTIDSDEAWNDFLRRKKFHPSTLDYMVTREGMGGMIHGNEFASRAHFLDYTRAFEERLAAAKAIKPGPGVLVFCGTAFPWRKSNLEDFADLYRTGTSRADDPFGKMQQHDIKEKNIKLLRNVDHFAFLQRPIESAQKQEFYFPIRGPRFGAAEQPIAKPPE